MADISTKVKKLNIFQQIRLGYYRNRIKKDSLTIDELKALPEYIKNTRIVYSDKFSDSELRKLNYRIVCQIKHDYEFIKEYPTDVRFNLFSEEIISPYLYTEEQRNEFLLDLIHEGKPNALQDIHWGYMPEIDENIRKNLESNGEKELADSILQYFDRELLSQMIKENPGIITKLNDEQQKEFSEELKKYIGENYKDNYRLSEYVSTRLECLQYLDKDIRTELSKYLIDYRECYETIEVLPEEESRSLMKSIYDSEDKVKGMQTISKLTPHMSGEELAIFIKNNHLISSQIDIIINSITSESKLADFFDHYREIIVVNSYEQKKNLGSLLTKYKKFGSMFYLSKENRQEMETEFMKLPIEERKKYVEQSGEYIQYLPDEEQSKVAEKNIKFLKFCSIGAKKKFLKDNPKEFQNIDENIMLELVAEDTRLYEFLPEDTKRKMQNDLSNKNASKAMSALLRKDIQNSKLVRLEGESKNAVPLLMETFLGIENQSEEKVKDYFLHSKFTSAIGKLSLATDILHGPNAGEEISGIDGYNVEQVRTIQKLKINQIKKLVEVDVNYVLPYLTGTEINKLSNDEITESKNKAKDLFIALYGKEKYEEYKECFEVIYQKQQENNEEVKIQSYSSKHMVSDFDNFKKHMEIPLEEFKILFNKDILDKCNLDQIKEYFKKIGNEENTQDAFLDIIKTTYGDKAVNIIKSRPQLNVHSINSLEIFNNQIIENYGDAFVHDSITYNLRDFSEFLEAQKNPETAEVFKSYYDILTGIYGEDVETMQKAISEFSYYKDLLLNIKDEELSNEQVLNLLNVISSEKNNFNIQTLEQLDSYNELANQELQEIIDNSNDLHIGVIKEKVCKNLLGMRYLNNGELAYGDSVSTLNHLYDFSPDESEKSEYTDTERRFMNIINYIYNETDKSKFLEFVKNVKDDFQIRNIPAFRKVIDKVQERELEELNQQISTVDKLDIACEQEKESENPSIYKEQIDGVNVYHLNGYKYCMFAHDSGTISDEDLLSYEGQGGNTAICSRVVTPSIGNIDEKFLYGKIPSKGIITMYNEDANTQHMAKRTKMSAKQGVNVKQIDKITSSGNEMAMYRKNRRHSEINNENSGGRIIPMAYGVSATRLMGLGLDEKAGLTEFAKRFKGTGISIYIIHEDRYQEKENIEIKEESER